MHANTPETLLIGRQVRLEKKEHTRLPVPPDEQKPGWPKFKYEYVPKTYTGTLVSMMPEQSDGESFLCIGLLVQSSEAKANEREFREFRLDVNAKLFVEEA